MFHGDLLGSEGGETRLPPEALDHVQLAAGIREPHAPATATLTLWRKAPGVAREVPGTGAGTDMKGNRVAEERP